MPADGQPDPTVEKIWELEERLDKFRISADSGITYRGNAWQGYAVNIPTCDEIGQGGTPTPPNPGACCLPDGTCETVTPGQCLLDGGTFIGGSCDPNPCGTPDCTNCNDLPPTNPSGPPVHINIAMTLSGSCNGITYSGTVTYDVDLSFHVEGPVGGHIFCAHDISENGQGHGDFWSGHWTATCNTVGSSDFGEGGAASILGRDFVDCSWWTFLPTFNPGPSTVGDCSACAISLTPLPFQQIAPAGSPVGTYNFSDTDSGVTLTIVITIS
jgi:hypothetical protein